MNRRVEISNSFFKTTACIFALIFMITLFQDCIPEQEKQQNTTNNNRKDHCIMTINLSSLAIFLCFLGALICRDQNREDDNPNEAIEPGQVDNPMLSSLLPGNS